MYKKTNDYQKITYKFAEDATIKGTLINNEPYFSAEEIAKFFGVSKEEVEKILEDEFENFRLDPNQCIRVLPSEIL